MIATRRLGLGMAGILLIAACGLSQGDAEPIDEPVTGGESGGGGGGASGSTGSAPSCIRNNSAERCFSPNECCSGMCLFSLHGFTSDGGVVTPESGGHCVQCSVMGEACGDRQGGCCSGFCDHLGYCSCAFGGQLCNDDTVCCAGYCYRERSTCLAVDCDPRMHPDADPEQCWRDIQ